MENSPKSANRERAQRILNATSDLITRYGYDKMSMNDVADAAGISKGAIYLHFASKDELFEAIFYREFRIYATHWYEHIMADPQGGTIGGIYKAVLYAVNRNPFITAVVKKDPRVLGNYLRKPDNLFTNMAAPGLLNEMVVALQEAGVIRRGLDPLLITYLMDMIAYGLVSLPDQKVASAIPPFDALMETIADMMDRLLTPPEGADSAAGKRVIEGWVEKMQAYFEQVDGTRDETGAQ